MTHQEPKLIPYEHTLYDLLMKEVKGKYFQNMMAPHLLFQIPEENQLGIHYVDQGKLSVWFPLLEKHGDVSLDEFHEYALISEEQFKEYQKNPGEVFDYLLVHKDSNAFKEKQEKNKANLSEQEPKIVKMKDYKSKQLKEAEERFYHLSDHLDPLFQENSNKKDKNPEESA